ncbi:MAG: BA14K family protein [Ahrensia sp.]
MRTLLNLAIAAFAALATLVPAKAAPSVLSNSASLALSQPAVPSAERMVVPVNGSQHYGSRENQTPIYGVNRHAHEYRGKRGYYNGYRGYRYARKGYRHHRGYYYPRAAFSFELRVVPRVHRPRYAEPRYRAVNRHVSWCANRYRTYRVSDNTYIPRVGHRAYCRSPFSR